MITRVFVEIEINHVSPLDRDVVEANMQHAFNGVWVGMDNARTMGCELIMLVPEVSGETRVPDVTFSR